MKNKDFKDPFNAGQMVGMMVMLTSIENNDGITQDVIDQIKFNCANNLQEYFDKPTEDIFLLIDNMVKDISKL